MPQRTYRSEQLRVCMEKIALCLSQKVPRIEQAIAAVKLFSRQTGQSDEEPLSNLTSVTDRRLRFSSRACEELERCKIIYLGQLLAKNELFVHTLNNRASVIAGLAHNRLTVGKLLPRVTETSRVNGKVTVWKTGRPTRAGWYWVCSDQEGYSPQIRFLEAGDAGWSLIAGPIKQPIP